MILKSECQACGGHLEFDHEAIGTEIECPHCHTVMVLKSDKQTIKALKQLPAPAVDRKTFPSAIGSILLSIAGIGLLLIGVATFAAGTTVFQECVGAIMFCSGALLIGMAFLFDALRCIARNQSK